MFRALPKHDLVPVLAKLSAPKGRQGSYPWGGGGGSGSGYKIFYVYCSNLLFPVPIIVSQLNFRIFSYQEKSFLKFLFRLVSYQLYNKLRMQTQIRNLAISNIFDCHAAANQHPVSGEPRLPLSLYEFPAALSQHVLRLWHSWRGPGCVAYGRETTHCTRKIAKKLFNHPTRGAFCSWRGEINSEKIYSKINGKRGGLVKEIQFF